jgi:ubiquinone/menaquinone biosynthesis C-methylase UbiE
MVGFYSRLAEYYDLLYGSKDYRAEVDKIHQLIQKYKTSPDNDLLDVACGTGRHAEHLKKHYNVTGLDNSDEMLRIAAQRNPDLRFVQGDMRSMNLGKKFDVVTCLFGSISYMLTYEDLAKALEAVSRHTKRGGIAVIEPVFTEESFRPGHLSIDCVDEPDVKIARVSMSRREGDVAVLDFHFLVATADGVSHHSDPNRMGLFSLRRINALMEETGFTVELVEPGLVKEQILIGIKE